ncbi:MAG TPA: serine hydrolase [Chitinophagaceae bacterium]|nr:serine hydrolase [Chitinophagaceae bacterium]
MKKILFLVLFIACCTRPYAQSSFVTDSLDSYISQGMADWQVPGLAIVIVKDGKVVLKKGYGIKDIVTKAPVDEHTLFMIASNSKLFTGLALAQLEYNKKISLDDKFTKYYPGFKLYDATITSLVTIKDLLSHRIGTKTFQGDFTFWNSRLTRSQVMEKMRLLKPTGLFRQDYGYCNSCFLAAGEVIPKVTGKQWESYMKDSIFTPLEMTSTYASIKDVPAGANFATPYTTSYTGVLNKVPYDKWDNLGPAASIISNVTDIGNWLLFQLDSGKHMGRQVMPFAVLQKTRDIVIVTSSRRSTVVPTHIVGYGLGLFVADYNGRQVYWHTGGAAGMVSNVTFVPEERLGIAIFTNNDNQNFYGALRSQLLDAYLGVPYRNRSKAYLPSFTQDMDSTVTRIARWKARIKGSTPRLPLKLYVGRYTNALYGSLDISLKDNRLVIKFNSHDDLTATLDYMDNDEWLMQYENIEYGIFAIKFKLSGGKVVSVETKQNEYVEFDPYVFIKSPAAKK